MTRVIIRTGKPLLSDGRDIMSSFHQQEPTTFAQVLVKLQEDGSRPDLDIVLA